MTKTVWGFLVGFGCISVAALIGWAMLRQTPRPTASAAKQPAPDPELRSVPRTSLASAQQEIERGLVLVIDVRDADSYIAGHIPGAVQIPLMRIEGEVNYLPRGKPILTYCT